MSKLSVLTHHWKKRREQMVFLGNPEFGCELQPIDFVAFAKACGGTGIAIEDPVDCGRILDRAPHSDVRVSARARWLLSGVKESTLAAGAFRGAKAHTNRTLSLGTPSGANQKPQRTFYRCSQSRAHPCAPQIKGFFCASCVLLKGATSSRRDWRRRKNATRIHNRDKSVERPLGNCATGGAAPG